MSVRGGIILFENPSSSLTWKTQGAEATPYLASVAACARGMDAFKSWLFCSNHPDVMRLASLCSHPKGTHPPLSGKRSSDGTLLTRLTALYPQSLADAVARSSGLQFLWARRRYRFSSGSSFCLLVSPSLSQNTGLRMDVARVALLPGLCLASRIPFQVCAMLRLTPCAQLDFCRKFFNALALLTKRRHCRRQSSRQMLTPVLWNVARLRGNLLYLTCDKLVQEELQQGWIREVAGGLPALREQYRLCTVGKLGLVQAPGRPPRLVVDSAVSAVTENTVLPNRSCNPTLAHLRRGLPVGAAREEFTALVLDVSKAHRRIKIRPKDQGLLCFHHRGKLFQCLTLNFGARASSYYWHALLAFSVDFCIASST